MMKPYLTAASAFALLLSTGCQEDVVSKQDNVSTQTAPEVPREKEANVPDSGEPQQGMVAADGTTDGASANGGDSAAGDGSASGGITVDDDGVARITMTVGDEIAYRRDTLNVPAGAKRIEVKLVHEGKLPVDTMGHNFVLLREGTDAQALAQAAMGAKGSDYIPPKFEEQIIAHTEMLGGGESDSVVFDAPDSGSYTFICTFPGHYPQMQGKLIVGNGGA